MENGKYKLASYTTTTDNIKYPTYLNDELDKSFLTDVDLVSLDKSFAMYHNSLDQFITSYIDALKSNKHDLMFLFKNNKKNAALYFLFAKGLKILCVIIQEKIKTQNNQEANTQNEEKSIEQLISMYNKKDEYGSILKKYYHTENELREALKEFSDYEKKINNSTVKCGLVMVDTVLKYSNCVCKSAIDTLKKFIEIKEFNPSDNKKEHKMNEIKLYELLINLDKFQMIGLCFNNSVFIEENDILNKPESSNEWNDVKRVLVRVLPDNDDQLRKDIEETKAYFRTFMAILDKAYTSKSNFANFFKLAGANSKYKRHPDDALHDRTKLLVNPDPKIPCLMLNILKIGFIKSLTVKAYPKIKFYKKLYLKRMFKEINLDYVQRMNNYVYGKSTEFEADIAEFKTSFQNERNMINKENNKPFELYVEKIHKQDKKYYISTRFLHNSTITFPEEKVGCMTRSSTKPNVTQDTLIVHIHGGGFIGMSTLTHESYLRVWANRSGIPVIGINYSLSPKEQYPKAIDDVWQAYNWIMKHAEAKFNIKLKRIIVSGDSAGGTLALSLTYLLIVHQARVPDLLMLQYPCSNTSMNNMNNSMLLCMEDYILSFCFLTYSCISYRGNYPNDDDPFLNPVKMPEQFLKQMPRTRFFFGSCDPLRDDTVRLLYKISKTNIDCKAYEFNNYIHGFNALETVALREFPTMFIYNEVDQFLKDTDVKVKK